MKFNRKVMVISHYHYFSIYTIINMKIFYSTADNPKSSKEIFVKFIFSMVEL